MGIGDRIKGLRVQLGDKNAVGSRVRGFSILFREGEEARGMAVSGVCDG